MFKRKKKTDKIPNKKTFSIPEIDSKKKKKYNQFVSPFFGDKVKDELIVPKGTLKGNINERFDDFRAEKKIKEEEGKRYKEFGIMSTKEVKDMISRNRPNIDKGSYETIPKPEEEKSVEDVSIPFGLGKDEPMLEEEKKDLLDGIEFDSIPPEDEDELIPDEILNFLFKEEKETKEEAYVNDLPKKVKETRQETLFEEKPVMGSKYSLPSLDLLKYIDTASDENADYLVEQENIINNTLEQFKVGGKVVNFTHGPTVTQYEIQLDSGVMISKLTNIQNNIKMNLAAIDIRIEAPIPGKSTIGIEVPNKVKKLVNFGNYITEDFCKNSKLLEVILGVDLGGNVITADINKMPHGLIAGATGSGKSVCIDTILMSLLFKASPKDLRLILIDPKRVGLAAYNKIPHLASPIIHDSKVAAQCLNWAVDEMERRYNLLYRVEARDLKSYNEKIRGRKDEGFDYLPNIVIIIEEMSDLMAQSSSDVELAVMRLAQKARSAGIHLLVATQRPSVDVIRGNIKSNIPTRIALKVASNTDSMTIIDYGGAESLLGNGDMLFSYAGLPLKRLQGAFVSDEEIDKVTGFLNRYDKDYLFSTESLVEQVEKKSTLSDLDDIFVDVARFCIETNYASINKIQKEFNIGYNRASDLFEQLEENGVVSSPNSKNPRKVMMDMETFNGKFGN